MKPDDPATRRDTKPTPVIRERPSDPNWLGVGSEPEPREPAESPPGAEPADIGRKMPGEVPPAPGQQRRRGRDPDLA
ncbi:MAG: hypothetical protein QHC78_12245 [Pigmentiphaga sp.]|uniref:hypothetical protein n=1 Tax=Pigmentiphaga sp. TaxID=1977564 RepID=UPI0029AA2F49|nr:hypothetical protein [Pigmentiphaga sp.]MDX3906450.1 hypothetical protein [Pigmentiphaga sp.]